MKVACGFISVLTAVACGGCNINKGAGQFEEEPLMNLVRRSGPVGRVSALRVAAGLAFALAALAIMAMPAHARITIKESYSYFPVGGSDGKSIAESLVQGGREHINLKHAIAATETDIDVGEPELGVRGGRCVIEDVEVTLKIRYILPKWQGSSSASRQTRERWEAFYAELRRHEYNHGTIAKAGAEAFERELLRTSGTAAIGCADFGAFARLRLAAVLKQTERAQQSFDRREYGSGSKITKLRRALYQAR